MQPIRDRGQSEDEIGELAQAFNDVEAVTIEVAQEQSRLLRKGMGDLFVNLARRNQSLLERQLELLDELERNEHDPAALDALFKLDHMATRMRRNAESLLVLSGRRAAAPVAAADRARSTSSAPQRRRSPTSHASSSSASTTSLAVSGRAVADVAHLLAELLENATSFSPPDAAVVVSGAVTATGFVLAISDQGIGMPPERIARGERAARPARRSSASRSRGPSASTWSASLAARHGISGRAPPRRARSGWSRWSTLPDRDPRAAAVPAPPAAGPPLSDARSTRPSRRRAPPAARCAPGRLAPARRAPGRGVAPRGPGRPARPLPTPGAPTPVVGSESMPPVAPAPRPTAPLVDRVAARGPASRRRRRLRRRSEAVQSATPAPGARRRRPSSPCDAPPTDAPLDDPSRPPHDDRSTIRRRCPTRVPGQHLSHQPTSPATTVDADADPLRPYRVHELLTRHAQGKRRGRVGAPRRRIRSTPRRVPSPDASSTAHGGRAMMQLSAEARNLNWLVSNFVERVPGVQEATVVSSDGLLIALSDGLDRSSGDRLAAVSAGLLSIAKGGSAPIGGGRVHEVIVEMDRRCSS